MKQTKMGYKIKE